MSFSSGSKGKLSLGEEFPKGESRGGSPLSEYGWFGPLNFFYRKFFPGQKTNFQAM